MIFKFWWCILFRNILKLLNRRYITLYFYRINWSIFYYRYLVKSNYYADFFYFIPTNPWICFFKAYYILILPVWGNDIELILSFPKVINIGFKWSFWLKDELASPINVWKIDLTWADNGDDLMLFVKTEQPLIWAKYLIVREIHFLTSVSYF